MRPLTHLRKPQKTTTKNRSKTMRQVNSIYLSKKEVAKLLTTHPVIVAKIGTTPDDAELAATISAQKVIITSTANPPLEGMDYGDHTEEKSSDADDLPALDEEMGEGDELALGEGENEGEDEGTSEPVPLTEEELNIGDNTDAPEEFEEGEFLGDEQELGLEEAEEEPAPPAFTED